MEKKRILEINVVYEVGSTGRIVNQLCKRFKDIGYDYYVIYGRGKRSEDIKSYKMGNIFSVLFNLFTTRVFDLHSVTSKFETKRVIKKIDEFDPDVIHLHNLHGYYLDVKTLFKYLKLKKIPVVWTLHDVWPITGHCVFFSDCQKWKEGCHKCKKIRSYPTSIMDNSSKNWNMKKEIFTGISNMIIVTPSVWLSEQVKESYLNIYPIKVIHNGIDKNIFYPRNNDLKRRMKLDNKFIVLAVANVWTNEKGYSDILKLANRLDINRFRIIMVGVTKKQLNSLPQNVIGIEKTNNIQELALLYNMADVFVNLTYADNYPTTNLEARACGLPIITYDVGGSSESAGDKAIIISPGDYETVYRRICEIEAMGVSDEYKSKQKDVSNERMIDEYIELIMSMVKRGSNVN